MQKHTGIETDKLDLHVDLDGSLLKCDLLHEQFLYLLMHNPLAFIQSWFVLFQGKAAFKQFVANHTTLENREFPANQELLEWLRVESHNFRATYLITASPQSWADEIKKRYGFIKSAHGSTKDRNLKGSEKAKFIQEHFKNDFVYVGNSFSDLEIWKHAKGAVVVGSDSLKNKCSQVTSVLKQIEPKNGLKVLFKALRVHQWAKNALVFLPLILAQNWFDVNAWTQALLAAVAFSLTASSVYLLNDLVDLESDRKHSSKFKRPFASGNMSILSGVLLIPLVLIAGVFVGFNVGLPFLEVLIGYYFLTTIYSFWLKKHLFIDAITLGCLYSIRIVAGGVATETPLSHWLLAFSTFFFLSLALVKRYTEIKEKADSNANKLTSKISGRGYRIEDLNTVLGLGLGSGMVSILVFTLYLNDPAVVEKLKHPTILWASSLLLLYWLGRVWFLASRGDMHDDPVVFAVKDKVSWFIIFLVGINFVFAAGALGFI